MARFSGSMELFPRAVIWFVLSLVASCANDVISKLLVTSLPAVEVAFFRFLFSGLTLLPIMIYYGKPAFYTPRITIHFHRGLLLCAATALWTYGLSTISIAAATLINFSIPLFVMILSHIFLQENVGWQKWVATSIGFLGIVMVIGPADSGSFNIMALLLILSAMMFAGLDVMNKHVVVQGETMLSMLFYSAAMTTCLCFIPLFFVWQTPAWTDLGLCFALGVGANLILYCLLKAFSLAEASALAPLRYVEFLLAASFGYLLFGEIPTNAVYIGAAIIIPATLFIVYDEVVQSRKRQAVGVELAEVKVGK